MTAALIILAALVAVGGICYLHYRYDLKRRGIKPEDDVIVEPEACCGMHITCEKDSLLASVSQTIEYYDDEELDRFAGRVADDYEPEEVEEFRDVLLTLRPEEIAGWGRSIQLRGIVLPAEVKEELLMIVAEARSRGREARHP